MTDKNEPLTAGQTHPAGAAAGNPNRSRPYAIRNRVGVPVAGSGHIVAVRLQMITVYQ